MTIKAIANESVISLATSPKTGWLAVLIVNAIEFYVDFVSPVIIALTTILSFVMMILLVRYHWINTRKIKEDLKAMEYNNKMNEKKENDRRNKQSD